MEFFEGVMQNHILLVSLFSCFLAQFIKIFTGKEKMIQASRIFISGGMPSSHSSFVTTLSTLVGFERGFDSLEFAIAAVFSAIIMYDASGVRRAVGKQAEILNKMLAEFQETRHVSQVKVKELMGHTPKEVFAGAMLGIIIGIIFK